MNGIRVLVGTHKGAFILTSDEKREKWDISGPHLRAGKSTISTDRQLTQIESMHRNLTAGSGK